VTGQFIVRPIREVDYAQWRPLWDGYNAFYGRVGATALPEAVTAATWERFFSATEAVYALVAEYQGEVAGLVHYLFHRSTSRLQDVCYLQDLYTKESYRGKGAGRQLIQAVYEAARNVGSTRVYWTTQASNVTARTLYDKLAKHLGFIVYSHEL
jgi:GNAT superfamily N-acetyltransferase